MNECISTCHLRFTQDCKSVEVLAQFEGCNAVIVMTCLNYAVYDIWVHRSQPWEMDTLESLFIQCCESM